MGHDIYAYRFKLWRVIEVASMHRSALDHQRRAIYELLDATIHFGDYSGFGSGCFCTTGRIEDALLLARQRPELDRETHFLLKCAATCHAFDLRGLEIEFC